MKNCKLKISGGFGLVEAIVAVSIAVSSILIVWKVYTFFVRISFSNPSLFQASFLAEEGIEAVKFMRDSGWNTNISPLSAGIPYTLIFNSSVWEATTTHSLINDKFDRRIILEDVYRDASGEIVPFGTLDTSTKKVTSEVSWIRDGATMTRQITTYVSNIFQN